MSSRMFRLVGIAIPVVALACGSWAFAQAPAPKKEEPKPAAAKPQEQKKEEPKKEEAKDIIVTATDAKLATFVELVKTAGLTEELKGKGPFTVFAPTDDAFKAFKGLDDLKKDKAKLAEYLKGYIVAKKVDAKVDKTAKPLAGAEIKLADKDGKVTVNETIKVTKTVMASNGEIMVIDNVITAAEKKTDVKKEEPKKEEPKKADKPAEKPAEKKPG